jgi:Protein of unknown function (DUF3105)
MADRREEKARLRQIREEAEKREAAEQRRKLLVGYGVAGVLTAAVVLGIVIVVLGSSGGGASGNSHIVGSGVGFSTTTSDLKPDDRVGTKTKAGPLATAAALPQAAKAAKCVLRNPPDEGNVHLLPSQPTPKYKSNPPTSGNHDPIPLANGAYDAPITNFRHAVHSLEHGRIEVEYKADLSGAEQLKIKGVVDEDFRDMILFQNPSMPWQVAAAAWDHYLGCKTYNSKVLDAIRAFRDTYRDHGPEPSSIQPS